MKVKYSLPRCSSAVHCQIKGLGLVFSIYNLPYLLANLLKRYCFAAIHVEVITKVALGDNQRMPPGNRMLIPNSNEMAVFGDVNRAIQTAKYTRHNYLIAILYLLRLLLPQSLFPERMGIWGYMFISAYLPVSCVLPWFLCRVYAISGAIRIQQRQGISRTSLLTPDTDTEYTARQP
jgi:hypothetical protein